MYCTDTILLTKAFARLSLTSNVSLSPSSTHYLTHPRLSMLVWEINICNDSCGHWAFPWDLTPCPVCLEKHPSKYRPDLGLHSSRGDSVCISAETLSGPSGYVSLCALLSPNQCYIRTVVTACAKQREEEELGENTGGCPLETLLLLAL